MNAPPPTNPFAASKVRPGQLPFLFDSGSLQQLGERLHQNRDRGQIVGPHGSGKSTLLLHLVDHLRAMNRHVALIRVPARDDPRYRSVLQHLDQAIRSPSESIVAVDGWDQLGLGKRAIVAAQVRLRSKGLMVTCHRTTRLPLLARTSVSPATAYQVLTLLLARADLPIDLQDRWKTQIQSELPTLLARHHGNLREVLFELYDRFAAPS